MASIPFDPNSLHTVWDFADPPASEQRFESLLKAPEVSASPAARAEVLTQLARAQGLQGRFEQAHATLDSVDNQVLGASPRVRVRHLLERGRVFNSAGEPKRAAPLFLEAWETAKTPELDYFAVDAAHMLAIVAPPSEQPAWAAKAIARADASEDARTRGWLGALYNNLGWTQHDAGDYAPALQSFQSALAAYEAHGKPEQVRIAKWAVARALRSLGRTDDALARQRALLSELDAAGEKDGYVFEEIGECLLALSRPDEAGPYFAKAHAILTQDVWLVEHEAARVERLRVLSSHASE